MILDKHLYKRIGDMSPDNFLQILIQDDGDIILTIFKFDGYDKDYLRTTEVEFCEMGQGGGRSPETRKALIELCKAIEKDNFERPID